MTIFPIQNHMAFNPNYVVPDTQEEGVPSPAAKPSPTYIRAFRPRTKESLEKDVFIQTKDKAVIQAVKQWYLAMGQNNRVKVTDTGDCIRLKDFTFDFPWSLTIADLMAELGYEMVFISDREHASVPRGIYFKSMRQTGQSTYM